MHVEVIEQQKLVSKSFKRNLNGFSGRLTMNPIQQMLLKTPPVSFVDEDFNQLQRLVFLGCCNTKESNIITLQEVIRMNNKGFLVNIDGMPHHIRQSKEIIARAVTYDMI